MFIVALATCLFDVVVDLLHKHVVKYFKLLKDIISDRDAQLTC